MGNSDSIQTYTYIGTGTTTKAISFSGSPFGILIFGDFKSAIGNFGTSYKNDTYLIIEQGATNVSASILWSTSSITLTDGDKVKINVNGNFYGVVFFG